jgi:outer membrane receptor for ferrienterochelin and colicin
MKNALTLIAVLFFAISGFANNEKPGFIIGKVTEMIDGKPTAVPFANVSIKGTANGATTDFDGNYKITVSEGVYEIVASFVGYEPVSKAGIAVKSGETTNLDFTVQASVQQLKETKVSAQKVTHTENAVLTEMKRSTAVVSGISSQQIAKSQDRDASEVIKRVPGVTIMNDRFVMVRGLSERYNSVYLNNVTTPSTESDVKAFSFDMIPSALIDRILIYKSPAPEISGEFAGGVIKVFTKNTPDENLLSVGYSASYRQNTTFNDFYMNPGSKTDWMGFDDGSRSLPSDFPANVRDISNSNDLEQLTTVGRSLSDNWGTVNSKAAPDQRFNITFARKFDIKKVHVGHITALNYSNTNQYFVSRRTEYNTYNPVTQNSDTIFDYFDSRYSNNVRAGLLHNWSFNFLNHKIEFKNIFNQAGMNQSTLRDGKNFEEGELRKEYSYYYMNRSIYTGQLSGEHKLFEDKTKIDWTLAYSKAKKEEPDWRRVRTAKDINATEEEPYQTYVPFGATPFFLGRLYFDLYEELMTGTANLEQKLSIGKFEPKVTAGVYLERKWRQFSARNLGYASANVFQFDNSLREIPIDQLFNDTNINSTTGLKIDEDTRLSDAYTAQNDLIAYYLALDIPFTKWLSLHTGARVENNRQRLESHTVTGNPVNVDNHIIRLLPSANLTANISEKMLIRGGFGITLNRPEFRELAPYAFYDFNFNSVNYGNDSLETPSIYNYDARWEYYPNHGEIISVGAFYKNFVNPIETYFVPGTGSGGTRNYTYRNAESASSTGIELEVRKTFNNLKTPFVRNLGVVLNASYIWSKINLGDKAQGQSENRPMMGQSPYIINSGIYYQNDTLGLQVNLLYNVIGERIVIVGSYGIPDVYEMPRNTLDLTITKRLWKRLDVKFGIQDILNQPYLLVQDANGDGKVTRNNDQQIQSYKRGSYYTLGLNFRF